MNKVDQNLVPFEDQELSLELHTWNDDYKLIEADHTRIGINIHMDEPYEWNILWYLQLWHHKYAFWIFIHSGKLSEEYYQSVFASPLVLLAL